MIARLLRRFALERKGNVAIIFALSLVPCVFLTGMGLDFASAIRKRVQLNAAADAAALAAVTPSMMVQSTTNAQAAALNTFNAITSGMTGVNSITPTITIASSGLGLVRTVTVSYTANSTNNFPNVLGTPNWPLTGSSQSTASTAPNIDFYLLLDNSPSMNIAATTAGINTMVANTSSQGGCAFACHESNPSADDLGKRRGQLHARSESRRRDADPEYGDSDPGIDDHCGIDRDRGQRHLSDGDLHLQRFRHFDRAGPDLEFDHRRELRFDHQRARGL